MVVKNGLLITHSCLGCQLNILSDVHLEVLDSFDWQLLVFLERYPGRGRPFGYSVIAFLRAFLYMELSGITSVRKLVRLLERDKYKMKNLGFNRLPHHSLFSRYKDRFGEHIPRIMMIINTGIMREEPLHMSMLGIDSTKVEAFSLGDEDADWGYDHIRKKFYYGYKVHLLYDLQSMTPICYTVTRANRHDNTQTRPLIKRLGARLFKVNTILADKAYDTKENIENHGEVGVLFIAARNKRNTKKPVNKYRIQDYLELADEKIDQLYKNRMDCEHANFLLKEQLGLSDLKTTGREKVQVKVGITLIARLIQALHQLIHEKSPRTTIIN
ncbi:putative transposase for insertion sequence element [Methanocella paludicola SANAE]|uniref:Transposase for insertion sequence element n=1 Tax=Methanocella paludicola (strain DSM 17711 / JCM 13418 / NBRC 101707 / SANAE) TaxID=304371 RepID=D1YWY1_METPS|nr:transposase [Methanocella paludicola]BAI60953.1 putative transposase for insertion sequence element [Methanocella paludicola SANAE]